MAKPKGRPPKAAEASPDGKPAMLGRTTIINLKGSDAQSAWLESVHRKTHIPKTTIVRLALAAWAEANEHEPFPMGEGD